MGRTLPTITRTIDLERESWKHFRRALRKDDQEAFDDLWRVARQHTAEASMASRAIPLETVFLTMLIGLRRNVMALEEDVEKLKKNRGVDL